MDWSEAFRGPRPDDGLGRARLAPTSAARPAMQSQEACSPPNVTQKEAFKRDWSSALKKAAGERVLDDPKLLRKSLKRETKAKQRSAEQWAERKKQQEKEQKERKLKRFQNITAKASGRRSWLGASVTCQLHAATAFRTLLLVARTQKKGNKARKIEKREKKLLRPGFEGRREGPVNKG